MANDRRDFTPDVVEIDLCNTRFGKFDPRHSAVWKHLELRKAEQFRHSCDGQRMVELIRSGRYLESAFSLLSPTGIFITMYKDPRYLQNS